MFRLLLMNGDEFCFQVQLILNFFAGLVSHSIHQTSLPAPFEQRKVTAVF